ncbi:MAG: YraN family protein [Bdellovibrio sp.]|nr:YraN family protein [Bdellovibrio sp.]
MLKSTSQNPHYKKSQSLGLAAEVSVIEKMKHNSWSLSFQRARTKIAEIDLIFEKQNRVALIEVKALNNSWRAFERIGVKQTQKLQVNLIFLASQFKEFKFFAAICWVDKKGKVYFVEVS